MWFNDKITKSGEVSTEGKFGAIGNSFYVFFAPKSADGDSVVIAKSLLQDNERETNCPYTVGTWNPVVLRSITITPTILSKYNVFWGMEH